MLSKIECNVDHEKFSCLLSVIIICGLDIIIQTPSSEKTLLVHVCDTFKTLQDKKTGFRDTFCCFVTGVFFRLLLIYKGFLIISLIICPIVLFIFKSVENLFKKIFLESTKCL